MTTDTLTRAMTTAAVLLVAALSAVVSFAHIRDLAVGHGGDDLTSALLPLLIDGTVAAMSLVMLRAARCHIPVPWLARFMLVLSVGATLAANTAFGAAFGVTGALLWTLPAVMFVGCVEVSVLMVRKTRPAAVSQPDKLRARADTLTSAGTTPGQPGPDTASGSAAARARPATLTVAEQAALLDRSPRQVARYRVDGSIGRRLAMASGNGKAVVGQFES